MITAAEARKITDEALKNALEQYDKDIIETANKGRSSFVYAGTIDTGVKEELKRIGYNINEETFPPKTTISW